MFWKMLKKRKILTITLMFIVTIFFIVVYKAIYMNFEQKQITRDYYKISNNKNVGYLSMSSINESYEQIYSELNEVDGVYLSNYIIDFSSDYNGKSIIINKYFYDTFIKGNVSEGQDLELEDFTQYAKEDMTIPVVIGPEVANNYNISVGDIYANICYTCVRNGEKTSDSLTSVQSVKGASVGSYEEGAREEESFINVKYKVIGTLDEGLKVPSVYNEDKYGINTLDNAIIIPFVIDKASLTSEQQKDYQQGLFTYPATNVDVIFDEGDISKRDFLNEISKLEKKYNTSIDYISAVDNLLMVQSEMGEYIEIMNVTIFFTIILGVVGIGLLLYKDLKQKKQIYIIYIINGSHKFIVFKQQLYYLLLIQLLGNVFLGLWIITARDYVFTFKAFLGVNILYLLMCIIINLIMYIYFRKKSIQNILNEVEKDD